MTIYLLGGHQTDFARVWSREGLDYTDMMREAIDGALTACRLEADDIDAVHVGNAFGELYRGQGHLAAMVAQVKPEFHGKPAMRHEAACASSSLGILAATAELEAGRYDCIMVVGVEEEKNLPGEQASQVQNAASWKDREGFDCKFVWPAVFGRVAMEYDERYGLDRRYLNRIAEINMGNAKRNPNAQTRGWKFRAETFTDDDEFNPVIEPGTRRQDCGQITDGAVGLVLASDRFMERYAARRGVKAHEFPVIRGWGTPMQASASWTRSSAVVARSSCFRTCARRSPMPGAAPASLASRRSTASKRTTASRPRSTWPSTISA
jgi:acetyl-CoA C-acetyltransferase